MLPSPWTPRWLSCFRQALWLNYSLPLIAAPALDSSLPAGPPLLLLERVSLVAPCPPFWFWSFVVPLGTSVIVLLFLFPGSTQESNLSRKRMPPLLHLPSVFFEMFVVPFVFHFLNRTAMKWWFPVNSSGFSFAFYPIILYSWCLSMFSFLHLLNHSCVCHRVVKDNTFCYLLLCHSVLGSGQKRKKQRKHRPWKKSTKSIKSRVSKKDDKKAQVSVWTNSFPSQVFQSSFPIWISICIGCDSSWSLFLFAFALDFICLFSSSAGVLGWYVRKTLEARTQRKKFKLRLVIH